MWGLQSACHELKDQAIVNRHERGNGWSAEGNLARKMEGSATLEGLHYLGAPSPRRHALFRGDPCGDTLGRPSGMAFCL